MVQQEAPWGYESPGYDSPCEAPPPAGPLGWAGEGFRGKGFSRALAEASSVAYSSWQDASSKEIRSKKRSHSLPDAPPPKPHRSSLSVAAANLGLDSRFVHLDPDAPAALLSPEHPYNILDVNDAWCDFSKYSKKQSVGQTLAVLYGQGTEHHLVADMGTEIGRGVGCVAILTCYTLTGKTFRNTILLMPVEGGTRLLAVCEMQFPQGKALPRPRLRIPSLGSAVLFGGDGAIMDCTQSWLDTCEFERGDVIGKTARLFQGPATEMAKAARITQAAKHHRVHSCSLTNYTKSGRPMTNALQLIPLTVRP